MPTLAMPPICIPRAKYTTNVNQVRQVFEKLFGTDCVESIDEKCIFKQEDTLSYKRYFIHFNQSLLTYPENVRQRLINGNNINIVYEKPWIWKCSAVNIHSN